ncbi:hypothetical protein [uncultured Alsobacter sp.]|uniref:hypothetical protein n=1 Tax=uncultured Alsobacter sp. TaxID=1748258 RepID=UPI0025E86C6C|nr:hypothetical protein [uncultured Alsobacter sp.]
MHSELFIERTPGAQLRVGDTLSVFWSPGRDRIVASRPYTGPLASIYPAGVDVVTFASGVSMAVDRADLYARIPPVRLVEPAG